MLVNSLSRPSRSDRAPEAWPLMTVCGSGSGGGGGALAIGIPGEPSGKLATEFGAAPESECILPGW